MINGQLFSEYFINEGIKETKDYSLINDDKELLELFDEIKSIYIDFSKRERPDEADTEDGLIRPILEKLGFYYSRQKSISKKGRRNIPDFVLFATQEDKNEFDRAPSSKKPWEKVICILEAKRWERPLDKKDSQDVFDTSVPSNKMLLYLSEAEIASNGNIRWGILTNGRVWRLYYSRFPSRTEGFIEIDLNDIFGSKIEKQTSLDMFIQKNTGFELFKIFYLFFRKEAFIPTEWRPDKTFLEIALEEGRLWEEKVTENLKDKIFGKVFVNLAKGFVESAKSKNGPDFEITERFLDEVYSSTLILLYRLLFLLYAEDRHLLPLTNPAYRDMYSLYSLRKEIANRFPKGVPENPPLSKSGYTYWRKLQDLFNIINSGDEHLGIPQYNGGLFNNDLHPFLEEYGCPDFYLVPAIDMLSRDYSSADTPKWINYRDLSVRHLGSIYEGLLEFKLKVAEQDLTIKIENGREVYKPATEKDVVVIKQGDIYLTNDKSERKATGSYYTPDYIVQYIVENTIGPLIQEKILEFEREIERIKRLDKKEIVNELERYGISPKEPISEENINKYKNLLLKQKDIALSILDLKILDPAMGSGHFLVGAVDYISNKLLELLGKYSNQFYFGDEEYESPLLEILSELREKIIENAKRSNYHIDESKLVDRDIIKRIVLKRCIYGVDLNPLAVELAKLSLWLHTFTVGAPLSFLDHHLRCGNSLIGALPGEIWRSIKHTLFNYIHSKLREANETMKKLAKLSDIDISEIERSKELYKEIETFRGKYKLLFDLYIGSYCYTCVKKSDRATFMGIRRKRGSSKELFFNKLLLFGDPIKLMSSEELKTKKYYPIIQELIKLAQKKQFFHWELEFPEIWLDDKKGFDVVLGNPPYGAKLDSSEKEIIHNTYKTNTSDSAAYFLERAIKLVRPNGYVGMIVPKSIAFYTAWGSIRNYIFNNAIIQNIGDVGIAFPDANYEQIILVLKRGITTETINTKIDIFEPLRRPVLSKTRSDNLSGQVPYQYMKQKGIIIFRPISEKERGIIQKIETNSILLDKFEKEIFRGVYIPDRIKVQILKKELYLDPSILEINTLPDNSVLFVNKVPDVKRYLIERFYEIQLEDVIQKLSKGNNRKAESIEEKISKIMRPRVFFKVLRGKRLVCYPDIKGNLLTTEKLVNLVLHNTNYSYLFISAVVNSKVPSWYIQKVVFSDTTETSRVLDEAYLRHLPIPKIRFSKNLTTLEKHTIKKLTNLYSKGRYSEMKNILKHLPSDSVVLHDFLSYLAMELIRLNREKYLFELYRDNRLKNGSPEKIYVLKTLMDKWEINIDSLEKHNALKSQVLTRITNDLTEAIKNIEEVIDIAVYHLYGLSKEEIDIIEKYFKKSKNAQD